MLENYNINLCISDDFMKATNNEHTGYI